MKLDCNKYRVNMEWLKSITSLMTQAERLKAIGSLAVSSGVPIIVICVYLGELYGFTDDLNQRLESLKLFYGVEEVLNMGQS